MRTISIVFGTFLLIISALLWLASFLTIGANDGEWGHISRTGSISHPELFTWTDWKKNDGTIDSFPTGKRCDATEFRIGHAHNLFFSFTAYEGRNETIRSFPALGPHWGASYNYSWAIYAFSAGTILIFVSLLFRRPNTAEQGAAANP
jgi:hypothetical protein